MTAAIRLQKEIDDDHVGAASGQLAVDGHDHLLVERLDQQCRQVLRGRSAGVAELAFIKSAVYRRLAAADLLIALIPRRLLLRHGAAVIRFTRLGGAPRRLAIAKFGTI